MDKSTGLIMTHKLSDKQIKEGWQIVQFGEIAREVKLTSKNPNEDGLEFYIGLEHLDPQSLRIVRKGIIAEDKPSFTRRFSKGQILFGKRRCYQKKAAVAEFDGICSSDIIVIEAIPQKMIPGLLPFIIQSDAFFDWAEKTSSGSLSPRTKWKSLVEFKFPLPPVERQKEILEVLEKITKCNQLYENLLYISKFNQNKYLTSCIIHNYSNKNKWVKIETLLLSSPQYGATETAIEYTEETYRYIRVTDINNIGKLDGTSKMGAPKAGNEKYLLYDNDFLIARSGNTVGKTLLYKELTSEQAIFAGYLIRLKINKKYLLTEYFKYYCRTSFFWGWIEKNARGGAQPNINNAKQIAKMEIPIPSIEEQKKIIIILNYFEKISLTLLTQKKKSNNLFQLYFKNSFMMEKC